MNRPRDDCPASPATSFQRASTAGFKDRRAFSAVTGITERTIGKLENAQRVGPETLALVALHGGWKPDSPRMILAGGRARAAAPPEAPEDAHPGRDADLETYPQAPSPGRAWPSARAARAERHDRLGHPAVSGRPAVCRSRASSRPCRGREAGLLVGLVDDCHGGPAGPWCVPGPPRSAPDVPRSGPSAPTGCARGKARVPSAARTSGRAAAPSPRSACARPGW